jgi:hypothetical protein
MTPDLLVVLFHLSQNHLTLARENTAWTIRARAQSGHGSNYSENKTANKREQQRASGKK